MMDKTVNKNLLMKAKADENAKKKSTQMHHYFM